jgi:Kef-type K+ transport system membrane component KefB
MDFLPTWPLRFNDLLLFSLLLGAGVLGGHLAGRTTFLPRITGYIFAGFLLGPSVSGLLTPDLLASARLFTDIALGLILYELGRQLDFDSLRHDRRLLGTGLLESALSFVLVFAALQLAGLNALNASIAAALGVSSSPAVILLVVRQLDARGPVTKSALNLVALNNVIAFFLFLTVLPLLHIEQKADVLTILLQPLYQLGVSLGIAYAMSRLTLWAARHIGQRENVQFALTICTIIGAIGLARMLNVSPLLALLALGLLVNYLDREAHVLEVDFGFGGELFFLLLFVVAGANLHVDYLGKAGLLALLFVVARQAGKSAATFAMMRYAGMAPRPAAMLGLTLTPMAGLAIGLSQMTADLYPQFGRELQVLVLAAVAILETIGPITAEFALRHAGEVRGNGRIAH